LATKWVDNQVDWQPVKQLTKYILNKIYW